jgi:hypothetical protein
MLFDQNTVLILGAGSSDKFPLGQQFIRDIILDNKHEGVNPSINENGITTEEYSKFVSQLKFADPNSIDAFLEENPHLVKTGKYAIAYNLMKKENENALFPSESNEGNWYKRLADELGIVKNGSLKHNKLKIFTYNYERSLEHYLARVIQTRMGISEKEAQIIQEEISIYHLHGSLGSLNPNDKYYREYNSIINKDLLKIAAESITIIFEQSDEYSCSNELKIALLEAKKIYFFGFGYHHVNMRRLMNSGLREKLQMKDKCQIVPLRYGIVDETVANINRNQFEGFGIYIGKVLLFSTHF